MSKTQNNNRPSKRAVVAVDPEIYAELGEVAHALGASNVSELTRMGLKHFISRVKKGELVNVNGKIELAGPRP